MSRIGNKPINIPGNVTVELNGDMITVKSSKGELKRKIHQLIQLEIKEGVIYVTKKEESRLSRSLHGLTRTLISNMVEGLDKGFKKDLEIVGVGYRGKVAGKMLTLTLGFSHNVDYPLPQGIEVKFDEENKNKLTVSGFDKELVGQVASKIRSYRKPEPYKGKGIKYADERVVRKAGKTAASSSK